MSGSKDPKGGELNLNPQYAPVPVTEHGRHSLREKSFPDRQIPHPFPDKILTEALQAFYTFCPWYFY